MDCGAAEPIRIAIGSKSFTEGVILGEMLTALAQDAGADARHRAELGGTTVVFEALRKADIDAYVEYSGTLLKEILKGKVTESDLDAVLIKEGLRKSRPLGFNNNYALGMREDKAQELNVRRISDLVRYPDLRLGFSEEFLNRKDAWPGLKQRYGLPQTNVRGMDHALAYRGLEANNLDVVDLYTTDAEVAYSKLRVLEDDLHYFPRYNAIILYRDDLTKRAPAVVKSILRLEGQIDEKTMISLNARTKFDQIPGGRVAREFLNEHFHLELPITDETILDRLAINTRDHLFLVLISLTAAVVTSIPLGIVAAKYPGTGAWILALVSIIQTLPSLALLAFMIPLLGLGGASAITALFLYSLLPIVRNTATGLQDVPAGIHESAIVLGLPAWARLWRVELPMASRAILSGIKTAAVINVGTATLGALIGAGGYGQPIQTGIRLNDNSLILQGAIPAALLALLVQAGFSLAEKFLVPRGLRLQTGQ